MPQTPHVERHFTAGETVRDVVIGMSDGLTVPFALPAGLSSAVASAHTEVAAGSIAMGLGGWPPGVMPSTTPANSHARSARSSRSPMWKPRR